ncbi:MAG: hypothetical protein ACREJM_09890 [Candidatus Saccharimonadales bacterium]
MKASELVKILQAAIEEHGDMEVFAWPYDGEDRVFPAKVDVCGTRDEPHNMRIWIEGN